MHTHTGPGADLPISSVAPAPGNVTQRAGERQGIFLPRPAPTGMHIPAAPGREDDNFSPKNFRRGSGGGRQRRQAPALRGKARMMTACIRHLPQAALVAGLALLAACSSGPPQSAALRDPGAGIWSAAAFAPAGIAGRWHQRAEAAPPGVPACTPGTLDIRARPDGTLALDGRLCLAGESRRIAATAREVGPGRLAVSGFADPWWVLWVDVGYRTLAIGTPSGRFGLILDRNAAGGEDRLTAARDLMEANGYAPARLRPAGR